MYNGGPHAQSINLGILVFALHEYLHQRIGRHESCRGSVPGHLPWSRTPAQYLQVRVGGYSSSWEAFQVDVDARTSNTAVLFAGVYLTVGSLRDPSRKSISTNCTMSKASQLL